MDSDAVVWAVRTSPWAGKITEVISGTAHGIDTLGEKWAERHGIPVKRFPADWNAHGKSAGPIRNRQMAQYADALIVVIDRTVLSPGSRNMQATMEALKKPVHVFTIP